jgi:hypothetical protein
VRGLDFGSATPHSQLDFRMWKMQFMEKIKLDNPFTHVPEKQLEKRLLINSNVIQTRCQSQS